VKAARTSLPVLTLAVTGLALGLAAAGVAPQALAYVPSRPTLLAALGCHLAHYERLHLVWDVSTFALLGVLVERREPLRLRAFVLLAALLVPPLACALTPWVRAYAGLSGLVLGQVALLLACELRRSWSRGTTSLSFACGALLVLLLGKQLYELQLGDTSLVTMQYASFRTVPAAHLLSVVLGVLVGVVRGPLAEQLGDPTGHLA
jgi:membrane associated rhomboid family serine protease